MSQTSSGKAKLREAKAQSWHYYFRSAATRWTSYAARGAADIKLIIHITVGQHRKAVTLQPLGEPTVKRHIIRTKPTLPSAWNNTEQHRPATKAAASDQFQQVTSGVVEERKQPYIPNASFRGLNGDICGHLEAVWLAFNKTLSYYYSSG